MKKWESEREKRQERNKHTPQLYNVTRASCQVNVISSTSMHTTHFTNAIHNKLMSTLVQTHIDYLIFVIESKDWIHFHLLFLFVVCIALAPSLFRFVLFCFAFFVFAFAFPIVFFFIRCFAFVQQISEQNTNKTELSITFGIWKGAHRFGLRWVNCKQILRTTRCAKNLN